MAGGPPPIPLLFGPMLIGVIFNTILYGILVMQVFIYMQTYKKDAKWIRYMIIYLFIIETTNTCLDIHMIYEPLILKYGTKEATKFFPIMLAADPLATVLVATPVQIFIGWRIKVISKATWLACIIGALAIVSFSGGIWLTATVIHIRLFSRKPDLHWPALMWLLSSAIVDVIITVSLVYHLSRRKTGFSGTDSAINRIIRLTIQTGMVTAIFASLDVICFLVIPNTTINFIWDFALCKLYTNALLSTLNARAGWGRLANAHTENNLLFGTDAAIGSKNTEATLNSYSMRKPMSANTGPHGGAGVTSTLYTYNTYEGETQVSKSPRDLEYGVQITKEIATLGDDGSPRSHLDMKV